MNYALCLLMMVLSVSVACSPGTEPVRYACNAEEANRLHLITTPVPEGGFSIPVGGTQTLSAVVQRVVGSTRTASGSCIFVYSDVIPATVAWTSDDTDVAEVSDAGVVEGVSVGATQIHATVEEFELTALFAVTVHAN
jgi:hypothetical protein